MNPTSNVKVFISYSWSAPEHKEKFGRLAENLRRDGIECEIDLYELAPEEPLPAWMERKIEEADYVLISISPEWKRAYENRTEKGGKAGGKGVTHEAQLIRQLIYDERGRTHCFIEKDFEPLLRHLTNQRKYRKSGLGKIPTLEPETFEPLQKIESETEIPPKFQRPSSCLNPNALEPRAHRLKIQRVAEDSTVFSKDGNCLADQGDRRYRQNSRRSRVHRPIQKTLSTLGLDQLRHWLATVCSH